MANTPEESANKSKGGEGVRSKAENVQGKARDIADVIEMAVLKGVTRIWIHHQDGSDREVNPVLASLFQNLNRDEEDAMVGELSGWLHKKYGKLAPVVTNSGKGDISLDFYRPL